MKFELPFFKSYLAEMEYLLCQSRIIHSIINEIVAEVSKQLAPNQTAPRGAVLPQDPIYVTLHSQDNFSWVLNCSLGPPKYETKVLKKFGMGYVKMHGFYGNP